MMYRLKSVSADYFDEWLARMPRRMRDMRAYPIIITPDGRIWPEPPTAIEVIDLPSGEKGFEIQAGD